MSNSNSSVAVVWNPSKTEREDLEAPLRDALGAQAVVEWCETSVDDPGQGAAARALDAGADLLLVAGGDGTVRAVAEHVAEVGADVEMGVIPLGTGNLLARNLEIPLGDIPAAIERALSGTARGVDVGWVDVDLAGSSERHGFVVMIGFGIDAHMIAETDDDLKSKAGWLAYVESLGRALSASEVVEFRLTVDDEPSTEEKGHTLLIGNCGTLQGGITLLPDADPSDGWLDYLLLSPEGIGQWAGTLKTMVWDNGLKRLIGGTDDDVAKGDDSVALGRAQTLRVELPGPRAFEIDGEEIGDARAFEVTLQPGAIRVR